VIRTRTTVGLAAAAALLAGCSSSTSGNPLSQGSGASGSITVGSNNFAESILLGDIYGEALKAKGLNVTYRPNIGTRETTYGMIKNGTLTVMPEYNGALLAYLDPKATPTTAAETDADVTAKLASTLEILQPSPAQDRDSVTVNSKTATTYHLTTSSTISDLAPYASSLVIGGSPEFQTRQQGLVGLKSEYGLTFKSFKALDAGGPLTEAALKNNDVQAADIFTTDTTIAQDGFVTLKDTKNLFGFENVIPLASKSLSSGAATALNAVSAKLDTATLLSLDAKVTNQGQDPLSVADAWLKSVGLS
jgi:osmoprotectant transport system substrate-binding protein